MIVNLIKSHIVQAFQVIKYISFKDFKFILLKKNPKTKLFIMTFDSSYYYIYFYLKEKSKIKIWKLRELKQYIGDL